MGYDALWRTITITCLESIVPISVTELQRPSVPPGLAALVKAIILLILLKN